MSSFEEKYGHLKISLGAIRSATNNFADENLIKQSGSGRIYKGKLLKSEKSIDIVARRFDVDPDIVSEGIFTEIMRLDPLKHPNLVSIVGFCVEDWEFIIIYKLESKGSLDQYLSDPITLTWTRRLQICVGIARTLSYIHYDEGRNYSVIHRNIKSSKILFDENWEPKLSGFELSLLQLAARRHGFASDKFISGTYAYIDPAYVKSGLVTHKSDVYSLGVLLFEVLCGRKAYIPNTQMMPPSSSSPSLGRRDYNSEEQYMRTMTDLRHLRIPEGSLLAQLAKYHYEKGTLGDIILPDLQKQMDSRSLEKFSEAAYCCLKEQRAKRPNIEQILFVLQQALDLQFAPKNSEHSAAKGTSTNHHKWEGLEHLKIGLDAIKLATENFSQKYYIGSGGYGTVYKAELEHFDPSAIKSSNESKIRSIVAIKHINIREDTQGEDGFIAEVEILTSCKHKNIVSLLGFCYELPHMILIYEYVPNGSLEDYLASEGKMTNLTWVERIKICIDIARGLDYIHAACEDKQKIIHRDMKSANILLGKNWEAKIADFGLSKSTNQEASSLITQNIVGTNMYRDPEYESTGKVKRESDIYSFGVVLFEILSGKLAYNPVYTKDNVRGLAPIARQHFENGTLKEMVDPKLMEEADENSYNLSKGLNQDSLDAFSKIAYQCLAEKQAQRPTMNAIIKELEKALNFQEAHKDSLRISLEDIRLATQNFNADHIIGKGRFGMVYRGEVLRANRATPIAVRRWGKIYFDTEERFLTEIEILCEYKHENIIGFVGYCDDNNENIIVCEYASNGSLDRHVKDASLTWRQRLKISIDVATGLDFLHGNGSTQDMVIHRDIKSTNILLSSDWKAKIADFGHSFIMISDEIDFIGGNPTSTLGYTDPLYFNSGLLKRESDIYSFGVVLFEMMCGRISSEVYEDDCKYLGPLVKHRYKERKLDELVFEGMKDTVVPQSLTTFQTIAYQCLHDKREKRPTANEVLLQLKIALEFQEDYEIWEAKLPSDYKEIIQVSKTPEIYSNVSKKQLFDMFFKGILLQQGKVFFWLNNNGQRNEMVSAKMFSYENCLSHKWRSTKKSRFPRVMKMMDISKLKIKVKIKTQFLSPNVIYGAHLVFKFCDPIKPSTQPMYVNLKYKMGSKTLNAYFATWRDDDWMMIELCQFQPHKKDVDFEVLLQSLSRCYCGGGAIYIEGMDFRAISDATCKMKPNSDFVQQTGNDYTEINQLNEDEKILSQCKANGKKCYMLLAKMFLVDASNVKRFDWKSLPGSRFVEVVELLSHGDFQIKCEIDRQKLSFNTEYACYLVFKLSQNCHGLHCPVKVHDVLLKKNKSDKFIYFKSPSIVNSHGNWVPKKREDGLMEVIVWEFDSSDKPNGDHIRINLIFRCYEGTMSGLIVCGIEFQPK